MAVITKRNEMPVQEAKIRAHNFNEVALGYNSEMAINEAQRCLNCKNKPCVSACPVNVDIPAFISKIKEGEFEEAYKVISLSSTLPAICGRVCPQESQCESKCTLGIKFESVAIGRLERFVADLHNKEGIEEKVEINKNGHKVAIIGSGPSGLACASDLAKLGYDVTMYEALHKAGGVLVYGIPEFRLPKRIVEKEINNLKSLGVDRIVLAREVSLEEIKKIKEIGVDLEVFIHGALCFSYSGLCYLSYYKGGRSGNRGNCAQPCRQEYELLEDGVTVGAGDFSSIGNAKEIELMPMKVLAPLTYPKTYNYDLLVWLSEDETDQNYLMDKKFRAKINVISAVKK